MRYNILLPVVFFLLLFYTLSFARKDVQHDTRSSEKEQQNTNLKHSVGSSLYLLGNVKYKEPVYDLYVTYGYRWRRKNVLILEGMT